MSTFNKIRRFINRYVRPVAAVTGVTGFVIMIPVYIHYLAGYVHTLRAAGFF